MKNDAEVINKCLKLKQQKKGINSYLIGLGYSALEIEGIKRKVSSRPASVFVNKPSEKGEEDCWLPGLKFTEKYVYNKEDDKYVIYLKSANGNIVLPGETVRGIIANYSNWCSRGHSVNEICRNYRIPRNYFTEIKTVFGLTHDSEPVSLEELKEKDVNEIAEDLIQKKKFQLHQTFHKKSWEETEEAASKWFKMQEGVYNPFTEFLNSWNPPEYDPIKYSGPRKNGNSQKAMIVGLSDVHFGAKTNYKDSYRGKGYSTEEAVECLKEYSLGIKESVEDRNYTFDKCVLVSLGDILHTTGSGFTTKGTMLVHDCVKEEQFNFAFESIRQFISNLLSLFPRVEVKSVKGNHNDFGDYILFKALECYFRTEDRISFENFQSDHGLFKVNKCLFIASHGYSAEYKGRIPTTGKARESYIANLFLSKPEALLDINQKVLLTADQHHLEMREYAEFEHYMLSTTVRGDKHSEAMGLNNIPRQTCFVLDHAGIKEIVYMYGK